MTDGGAIRQKSLWLDGSPEGLISPAGIEARVDDVVVGAGLTGVVTALLLASAGRQVTLLEARFVGAAATGNTTGKISLLQGTRLSDILARHSEKVAGSYLQANREGQAWLLHYCEEHSIPVQSRDAFSYASSRHGVASVRKEHDAARRLGLDTEIVDQVDVPFPCAGALRLQGQAQFDPMDALRGLAADFTLHGGRLHEGVRALGVSAGRPCRVRTTAGTISADNVVLATGTPFLDRGLYFAKLQAQRSYALAFSLPSLEPSEMYLSVDGPTRSIRSTPRHNRELLLVGGNGHPVGRTASHKKHVDDLIAWTKKYFPGAEPTHSWSAQDYAAHDHIPFVGKFPLRLGHVYLATGYAKWGMTNAVAAGLRISSEILGGEVPWSRPMSRRITSPVVVAHGALANAEVGVEFAKGWVGAARSRLDRTPPPEGGGVVGREGVKLAATSTVEGVTCKLSAVCTHLGGIVHWNDAEKSWDCPLHGSRFDAGGNVLEGPATRPLAQLD